VLCCAAIDGSSAVAPVVTRAKFSDADRPVRAPRGRPRRRLPRPPGAARHLRHRRPAHRQPRRRPLLLTLAGL
jgi:hypothetical protein